MKNVTVLVLGAALPAALLWGCGRETAYEKPLVPVRAQMVKVHEEESGVRYSAAFKPNVQVELAFRVGGYVCELMKVVGSDGRERAVQEGDRVKKGTPLAKLREGDYVAKLRQAEALLAEATATVDQAEAQLSEAKAESGLAKSDFERASELYALRSLTKPEYEAARARAETGRARVRTAMAQREAARSKMGAARGSIQEAELALLDTVLRAPLDGVVIKRGIEVGSLAAPGATVFVIADTDTMKVTIGVPDTMLEKFPSGAQLTVKTEAWPGKEFHGAISRISPAADPTSRIFEVEVSLPNQENRLKSGMIASVPVVGARLPRPVPVVPLTALLPLQKPGGGYALFVVEDRAGKQTSVLRPVVLGEVYENTIAVTEGIKPGELVITAGAQFVVDGQAVQVTQPAP